MDGPATGASLHRVSAGRLIELGRNLRQEGFDVFRLISRLIRSRHLVA